MDQERHRFVQQYVERQKAYLPTYTAVDPLIERHGTPLKPPPRSDEYGFDTPVLRPRAPVKSPKAQPALQAGPGESRLRTHEADLLNQVRLPTPHKDARLEARDADLAAAKKGKSRIKRKKEPTPTSVDTDDERAARLADRRERKRKKRAIVNPPQSHNDDVEPTAAPKKGRTNGKKVKKPAALALLYGFSATNVTKDRLTVKPTPSLGVFSKGKASAKKKVTARKGSSSRNELFSEFAFLNGSSERVADPSKVADDSDDCSVSSVSSIPRERGKKNRTKCAGTAAAKAPLASTRKAAESDVWDIELQSKLPSSVCDVSSEPRAESSTPVVLDLRRAEWSACLDTAEKHAERLNGETRTPSIFVTRCRSEGHSAVRSSPLAISNLRDELGLTLAADVSSIHPSHSASQVGARVVAGPSDLRLVPSKHFAEPTPAPVQELPPKPLQVSKSTDGVKVPDSGIPEHVRDAALGVQAIRRVASPINSLISVPQSMVQHQTRYDMVSLGFPSDSSPYEGFCADMDVRWEPLGGPDHGCVESCISVEPCHHLPRGEAWDWYPSWSPSAGLAIGDVDIEVTYDDDPLAPEYGNYLDEAEPLVGACHFEMEAELDPEEENDRWYCGAETRHDSPTYEGAVDGVYEVSMDGEEDVPGFLEGRALLLGIPENGIVQRVGMTGLAQAELDVASRLRDHWRPLRL